MPNLAALRAAIFLLSAKNRWGGAHMCPPPAVRGLNICPYCNSNTVPTVNHLLLECHHFDLHRRHITAYCRQENVPLNIEQLLGDKQPELLTLLFQYLRETKLAGAL